jgi:hypothetical protein
VAFTTDRFRPDMHWLQDMARNQQDRYFGHTAPSRDSGETPFRHHEWSPLYYRPISNKLALLVGLVEGAGGQTFRSHRTSPGEVGAENLFGVSCKVLFIGDHTCTACRAWGESGRTDVSVILLQNEEINGRKCVRRQDKVPFVTDRFWLNFHCLQGIGRELKGRRFGHTAPKLGEIWIKKFWHHE